MWRVIAAHHLRRLLRNPGLILILAAIPVSLALIEYLAFGRTVASGKLPPIRVLVLDEDKTLASAALPRLLSLGPLAGVFEIAPVLDRRSARDALARNQASALIVVPRGLQDGLLRDQPQELGLALNPIQRFAPQVAEGALGSTLAVVNQVHAEAAEPLRRIRLLADSGRELSEADVVAISAGLFKAVDRVRGLSALPEVELRVERPGAAAQSVGPRPDEFFAVVFPGLVVFALLFIAQSLALRLLRDRQRGLQRRLLATPASRAAILWGGVAYLGAALCGVLALLAALGAVVFRIPPREPLAVLLLGVGLAGFTAGLHLLIVALARTDKGAASIGSVLVLLLSLLGGSFVPAEQYPPLLRALALLLPNGAAQQGLVDVLAHGRTLLEVSARVLNVWTWAGALLAAAVALEARRLMS